MSRAFEVKLSNFLENKPKLTAQDRKLRRILALPRSRPRRKRILGNVENAAAQKLIADGKFTSIGDIDWTAFLPKEFAALIQILVPLIKAILDLFDGDDE